MKRLTHFWLAGAVLSGLLFTMAAAQNDSLADYARQRKKEKQTEPAPKKVYDNDNLPRTEHLSVVGQQPPAPPESISGESTGENASEGKGDSAAPAPQAADQGAAPAESAQTKAEAPRSTTPGESVEDRQKVHADWQAKISEAKQAVDLAQRELDVVQREYKLRAAAVYADVGYRLRNSAQWDKEDRDFKQQIEAKQKALDAARKKLADTQEQARKAGVPPKARE